MPTLSWIQPVFDRVAADIAYGNEKGAITATVLNRIENDMEFLRQLFTEDGIAVPDFPATRTWRRSDYLLLAELNRIEQSVKQLRTMPYIDDTTPDIDVSQSKQPISYVQFNNIEKILFSIYGGYLRGLHDRIYCGEFYCGSNKDGQHYEIGSDDVQLATGVTCSLSQIGGVLNTSNTRQIRFVFSQAVTHFSLAAVTTTNIQLTNLQGSGTTYTADVASITAQGTAVIAIAPFGDFYDTVTSRSIQVYQQRSIAFTLVSGNIIGGMGGTLSYRVDTTNVQNGTYVPVVSGGTAGLSFSDITIHNNTGVFTVEGSEAVSAGTKRLTVTVDGISARITLVVIAIEGFLYADGFYANDSKDAQLPEMHYGEPRLATCVSFTAAQVGGTVDTATSTGIRLTFSAAVTHLKLSDITVTSGTGSVAIDRLIGSGTTWTLKLSDVITQGTVTIKVATFGDFYVTTSSQTVTVYRAKTITIQQLSGTVTEGRGGTIVVSFITDGVADGTYPVTLSPVSSYLSTSTAAVQNGAGSFSITALDTIPYAGYTLTATLDGATCIFKLIVVRADVVYSSEAYAMQQRNDFFELGYGNAAVTEAVTYTVVQRGGATDTATTTSLRITFNKAVAYFTADKISITSGTGAVVKGELVAVSDKAYDLEVTTTAQGTVIVGIANFGGYEVITTAQTVNVYVARTVSITAVSGVAAVNYTSQLICTVTTSNFVNGVYALSGTLPAGLSLVGSSISITNNTGQFIVNSTGTAVTGSKQLTIRIDGISTTFMVYVMPNEQPVANMFVVQNQYADTDSTAFGTPKESTLVTYTATQIGGAGTTSSSVAIRLVFSRAVSNLTASKITLIAGSGSAVKGVLSGSGTTYDLTISNVSAGDITVSVADFGEFYLLDRTKTVTLYVARSVSVGTQIGAIAYGSVGSVTFPVNTIAFEAGTYAYSVTGTPAGITATCSAISNNTATLTLSTDGTAVAGKFNCRLVLDGTVSGIFVLAITN